MMGLRASVVLLALLAGSALAQPKPPTDAQKQQAGDLVKKAIAKSQAGDHEAAIKLYLDAYAIVPNAILLSNVGAEYQLSQKPYEALRYFCMYLEKDPTGSNATYVTAQAKAVQRSVGQPDTEACPKAPVVEPPKLEPKPDIVIKPVEPVAKPKPADPGRGMRLVGLGIGGAGVVTLGVGIFFGFQAKHYNDLIEDHDITVAYTQEELDAETKGPAAEKKQIIFTVAGGAVAAAGIVVYFIGRSKKSSESSSVTLVPSVTQDAVGAVLGGRF